MRHKGGRENQSDRDRIPDNNAIEIRALGELDGCVGGVGQQEEEEQKDKKLNRFVPKINSPDK